MAIAYQRIFSYTVPAGGIASINIANIPQTFQHLVVNLSQRNNNNGVAEPLAVAFNQNTNQLYSNQALGFNGSSVSADRQSNNAYISYNGLITVNGNTSTANSFGVTSFVIPNYSGNTFKSVIIDGGAISIGTATNYGIASGLFRSTDPINGLKFVPYVGTLLQQNTTVSVYGIISPGYNQESPKAVGGIVSSDSTYWYHTFIQSGSFNVKSNLTCEILQIAGGGGAGGSAYSQSGGGGAGGLLYFSGQSLTASQSYRVTVGNGGSGGTNNNVGSRGGNSQFGSLTASVGGGGGGSNNGSGPTSGGSGGGSGNDGAAGGAGTAGQGFAGSQFSLANYWGGGGGGATETPPNNIATSRGGDGSSAYSAWGLATGFGQNVSGTYWFAGGGAGSVQTGSRGGYGGGGGPAQYNANGISGTPYTGGGGGGGTGPISTTQTGGNGGSGIVIVRYPR